MGTYGWKATIGLIVPPRTNETILHELFKIAPDGISWCISTLGLEEFGDNNFEAALKNVQFCAKQLEERGVNAIYNTGIPLETSKNVGYHEEIIKSIKEVLSKDIFVSTDISAVMEALQYLQVKKFNLVSIYQPYIQKRVENYFNNYGFEILHSHGLDYNLAECITKPTFDTSFEVAIESYNKSPEAEAIFLSCPQWPIIQNINKIESNINIPVISQVQAIMWQSMRFLGLEIEKSLQEYGTLFNK